MGRWESWEIIAQAQAQADQQDAERREHRSRPKPPEPPPDVLRATETPRGWDVEGWGTPRPPGRAVEANAAQRAVWVEEHEQTVAGLVALLRSFLPPTEEDTDG